MGEVFQLQEPLTEGGVRSVNFFNGRLLTGGDLGREQTARREVDARLGLAVGDGVAFGLEVTDGGLTSDSRLPTVKVAAGLAINRLGQTLRLTQAAQVALARGGGALASGDCLFGDCAPVLGGTYVAGAGVYILTLAPAEARAGSAPTNGLDPDNVRCNTDVVVSGVQLRLLAVPPSLLPGLSAAAPDYRNALAYRAFGTGMATDWTADLLGAPPRADDLTDAMRRFGLGDADVPLALLAFTRATDLTFIDAWSVRRPLAAADPGGLATLAGARRVAVGQAMFRQFQEHIADLTGSGGGLGAATAAGLFGHLPAAGIIPAPRPTPGQSPVPTFFQGLTVSGPRYLNAAEAEALIRESLVRPPITVGDGAFVQLYRVAETDMAIDQAPASPSRPAPFMIFASGHLPYRADARFDLFRWDYAHYALRP
ncbi:hypothetical protein ASD79_08900 [Caulobacter sp. Root655]|uniref:hypothetical protein n=1 Tax=Caulobacter sp. Root655 TaxID=1736578 RepID=UPI0007012AA6|nr:hypothetical protein [Caulobacter sp. Root655]KRA60342.1 hypothetical protein ASD79_08900 [Caulobacter sp. Root655]